MHVMKPSLVSQVRQLQPQGVACWWQPGHSGWAIYPVDSESFVNTGTLESTQQSDQTRVTAPVPSSMGEPERRQLRRRWVPWGGACTVHLCAGGLPSAPCTCPALGGHHAAGWCRQCAGCRRDLPAGCALAGTEAGPGGDWCSVCLQACRPTSPCRDTPCRRACRLGVDQVSCSRMGHTR